MGFKTRFLLYTVPGQVFYNATRKLVLKGADAIVFVADSEVGKMEENKESLANLRANLAEYGLEPRRDPLGHPVQQARPAERLLGRGAERRAEPGRQGPELRGGGDDRQGRVRDLPRRLAPAHGEGDEGPAPHAVRERRVAPGAGRRGAAPEGRGRPRARPRRRWRRQWSIAREAQETPARASESVGRARLRARDQRCRARARAASKAVAAAAGVPPASHRAGPGRAGAPAAVRRRSRSRPPRPRRPRPRRSTAAAAAAQAAPASWSCR